MKIFNKLWKKILAILLLLFVAFAATTYGLYLMYRPFIHVNTVGIWNIYSPTEKTSSCIAQTTYNNNVLFAFSLKAVNTGALFIITLSNLDYKENENYLIEGGAILFNGVTELGGIPLTAKIQPNSLTAIIEVPFEHLNKFLNALQETTAMKLIFPDQNAELTFETNDIYNALVAVVMCENAKANVITK